MTIGIYEIENIETGQKYRGQSINIERRIKEHKYGKETKTQRIDRAIKKYGWDAFEPEILEIVKTVEQANERERYYISEYQLSTENILIDNLRIASISGSVSHGTG